jgi:hypothetical protein
MRGLIPEMRFLSRSQTPSPDSTAQKNGATTRCAVGVCKHANHASGEVTAGSFSHGDQAREMLKG